MKIIDLDKVRWKEGFYDMHTGEQFAPMMFNTPEWLEWATAEAEVKAIPLDKPFCKMVYGDYVCYNRNWLMKHLPMEVDILQGEAITVEFIEKKIAEYNDWNEDVEPLLKLIEDWRKANEESLVE